MTAAATETRAPAPPGSTRLLRGLGDGGGTVSLESHLRRLGAVPDRDDVIDVVTRSGLRGRGGAAFPTATKLAAVRAGRGRAIVVANGAEGEPASGKDKVLLAYAPHLVLDGAVVAARAVGAREAIVAVNRSVAAQVTRAVAEREGARLDRGVALRVVAVPDRFVAGQETALVRFLNGGPALPTFTPPRPFERGVGGAPTLVQNVETLAQLALLTRFGADWFRSAGTDDEPGTALVTLSGGVRRPGVYEVALGSPLHELVASAGGLTGDVQAFLVGGYFGTWVTAAAARTVALSDADLGRRGASLGAGAIVALPASACGVVETARVARYLSNESAGQCGPCVYGLASVAGSLEELVRRRSRVDRGLVHRRLRVIAGRGACSHPDGAVRLVASAYETFAAEFERHERGARCTGRGGAVLPVSAGPR